MVKNRLKFNFSNLSVLQNGISMQDWVYKQTETLNETKQKVM